MAAPSEMSIGGLAGETGVKVPTIRYYESVDLLPTPIRTQSNRRLYGIADVRRLNFIRHARELGFEVEAIRELLTLAEEPQKPCTEVDDIATAHLADIESKIGRLKLLQAEVKRMLGACARGKVRECRVIEALASHSKCCSEHRSANPRRCGGKSAVARKAPAPRRR